MLKLKLNKAFILVILASLLLFVFFWYHNKESYFFLSVLVFSFYFIIALYKQSYILSLFLSGNALIYYSLIRIAQIDNLIVITQLFLVVIALTVTYSKNKKFALRQSEIFLFLLLLFSSFSSLINMDLHTFLAFLSYFMIYTLFPTLLLISTIQNKKAMYKLLDFTFYVNSIVIYAFILLYVFKEYGYFRWVVDSSIGLSVLCLLNMFVISALNFKTAWHKITFVLSLLLLVVLFQRAFLLAVITYFSFVYLVNTTFKKKIAFVLVVFVLLAGGVVLIPNTKLYKVEYLTSFISESREIGNLSDNEIKQRYGSIGSRIILWKKTIEYTIDNNIILGNGYNSYSSKFNYKYPHNIFVHYFYSFGFLGLLSLLGYIVVFSKEVKKLVNNKIPEAKYLIAGGISLFVVMFFSGSIKGQLFFITFFYFHFILLFLRIFRKEYL